MHFVTVVLNTMERTPASVFALASRVLISGKQWCLSWHSHTMRWARCYLGFTRYHHRCNRKPLIESIFVVGTHGDIVSGIVDGGLCFAALVWPSGVLETSTSIHGDQNVAIMCDVTL